MAAPDTTSSELSTPETSLESLGLSGRDKWLTVNQSREGNDQPAGEKMAFLGLLSITYTLENLINVK